MFDWGRVWLIARRELQMRFKQRSYRWTTIIQVVIVALLALSPVLIAKFAPDSSDEGVAETTIVVVDEADANLATTLPLYLDTLGADSSSTAVQRVDSEDEARRMVDDADADAALIATRDGEGQLVLDLINESGDASSVDAQRLIAAASAVGMEDRIATSELSSSEVQEVFAPPAVTVTAASGEAVDSDDSDGFDVASYVISFAATILLFMAIVLYGQWIATGVVEEKSSRIMEIMVNAATPRDLLAGKVIGIMLAALCQFGPMLIIGGLIFGLQPQIADLVGADVSDVLDIDFGALSTQAVSIFLVYFLLGFVLYGSLYAGVGSLVSRQEEVNQAIAPMTTVMFVGYFAAISTLGAPDSMIAKIAYIFPMTSPFVAVPRVLLGDPGMGEIALSIGLLLVAVLGAMWLAGRLYRTGVLMYGQRPSWKSLLTMGGMQQVSR